MKNSLILFEEFLQQSLFNKLYTNKYNMNYQIGQGNSYSHLSALKQEKLPRPYPVNPPSIDSIPVHRTYPIKNNLLEKSEKLYSQLLEKYELEKKVRELYSHQFKQLTSLFGHQQMEFQALQKHIQVLIQKNNQHTCKQKFDRSFFDEKYQNERQNLIRNNLQLQEQLKKLKLHLSEKENLMLKLRQQSYCEIDGKFIDYPTHVSEKQKNIIELTQQLEKVHKMNEEKIFQREKKNQSLKFALKGQYDGKILEIKSFYQEKIDSLQNILKSEQLQKEKAIQKESYGAKIQNERNEMIINLENERNQLKVELQKYQKRLQEDSKQYNQIQQRLKKDLLNEEEQHQEVRQRLEKVIAELEKTILQKQEEFMIQKSNQEKIKRKYEEQIKEISQDLSSEKTIKQKLIAEQIQKLNKSHEQNIQLLKQELFSNQKKLEMKQDELNISNQLKKQYFLQIDSLKNKNTKLHKLNEDMNEELETEKRNNSELQDEIYNMSKKHILLIEKIHQVLKKYIERENEIIFPRDISEVMKILYDFYRKQNNENKSQLLFQNERFKMIENIQSKKSEQLVRSSKKPDIQSDNIEASNSKSPISNPERSRVDVSTFDACSQKVQEKLNILEMKVGAHQKQYPPHSSNNFPMQNSNNSKKISTSPQEMINSYQIKVGPVRNTSPIPIVLNHRSLSPPTLNRLETNSQRFVKPSAIFHPPKSPILIPNTSSQLRTKISPDDKTFKRSTIQQNNQIQEPMKPKFQADDKLSESNASGIELYQKIDIPCYHCQPQFYEQN